MKTNNKHLCWMIQVSPRPERKWWNISSRSILEIVIFFWMQLNSKATQQNYFWKRNPGARFVFKNDNARNTIWRKRDFELFVFSRVEQSETIHSPFNTHSIYYKEAQSILYYWERAQGLISFSFNSRFQLIYWTRLFFPRVFHRPSQQRTRKWPQCTELIQTKRVLSVPISESICVFVRPGPGVKYNSLVFNDLLKLISSATSISETLTH